ncbi:MAG: hypothetical protein QM817_32530 [Archangium sp.]
MSSRGLETRLVELASMTRGTNAVRIERDEPPDSLEVVTWMPAMGHGSSVEPVVERDGDGFNVSQLVLTMPGTWELRCTLGSDDHATFTVQVP